MIVCALYILSIMYFRIIRSLYSNIHVYYVDSIIIIDVIVYSSFIDVAIYSYSPLCHD